MFPNEIYLLQSSVGLINYVYNLNIFSNGWLACYGTKRL